MKAYYPLSRFIAGFDFYTWMQAKIAQGATEIVFDLRKPKETKWDAETVMRRFETILWPGPDFAGLHKSVGEDEAHDPFIMESDLIAMVRAGAKVKRLKSILPPKHERYTVTLRKQSHNPHRNSLEYDWRKFADEIGAFVIEDYDVKPISIYERMAYYAGAEMNFFVTNGPWMLCLLSEYPAMAFGANLLGEKLAVPYGEPYPWMLPQHTLVYETATLDVLRRTFCHWRSYQVRIAS